MMTLSWLVLIFLKFNDLACTFPRDTTIFEFGTKEHSYGGLRWDFDVNFPKPFSDPVNETLASLFQYITPQELPSVPFPTSGYSMCWNMNIRVFGNHQQVIMRLFHEENKEWSSDFDYWHALHFSPDRGILIMRVNSVNDSSKKGVYSGGLGFAL